MPRLRVALVLLAISIFTFAWEDVVSSFLSLESYTSRPVVFVSCQYLGSVYWVNLEVDGKQSEGYTHYEPEIGSETIMVTKTGQVYFDYLDTLAFVDGELNHEGGLFVLNLRSRTSIAVLSTFLLGVGWATLVVGIYKLCVKRRIENVS